MSNKDQSDRTLLELAAKAAGIEIIYTPEYRNFFLKGAELGQRLFWNPLTDDGDALRLAVKLKMLVDNVQKGINAHVICCCWNGEAVFEPIEPDPYAATRRAIVRAAAQLGASVEIGESM